MNEYQIHFLHVFHFILFTFVWEKKCESWTKQSKGLNFTEKKNYIKRKFGEQTKILYHIQWSKKIKTLLFWIFDHIFHNHRRLDQNSVKICLIHTNTHTQNTRDMTKLNIWLNIYDLCACVCVCILKCIKNDWSLTLNQSLSRHRHHDMYHMRLSAYMMHLSDTGI